MILPLPWTGSYAARFPASRRILQLQHPLRPILRPTWMDDSEFGTDRPSTCHQTARKHGIPSPHLSVSQLGLQAVTTPPRCQNWVDLPLHTYTLAWGKTIWGYLAPHWDLVANVMTYPCNWQIRDDRSNCKNENHYWQGNSLKNSQMRQVIPGFWKIRRRVKTVIKDILDS